MPIFLLKSIFQKVLKSSGVFQTVKLSCLKRTSNYRKWFFVITWLCLCNQLLKCNIIKKLSASYTRSKIDILDCFLILNSREKHKTLEKHQNCSSKIFNDRKTWKKLHNQDFDHHNAGSSCISQCYKHESSYYYTESRFRQQVVMFRLP